MNISIEKKSPEHLPSTKEIDSYVGFLYKNLQQYGDSQEAILKAIEFALGRNNSPGGFILIAKSSEQQIVGITVVLHTLMHDFIPENILVYIATCSNFRGQGIGKQLMKEAISLAKGSIALHVDPDNPAKALYEKLGFENKYLEMRLTR
ncbi:GNAT family N-acetyltransferase [Myroides sp. LJL115]